MQQRCAAALLSESAQAREKSCWRRLGPTGYTSRALMERVGMTNANEDFDHPKPALPEGSALKRMCLYRLSREQWLRGCEA